MLRNCPGLFTVDIALALLVAHGVSEYESTPTTVPPTTAPEPTSTHVPAAPVPAAAPNLTSARTVTPTPPPTPYADGRA
jgi:hypothetical protein